MHGGVSRTMRREYDSSFREHLLVEARADASGVDERVADVIGELQGAEMAARPFGRREADDDEVARAARA